MKTLARAAFIAAILLLGVSVTFAEKKPAKPTAAEKKKKEEANKKRLAERAKRAKDNKKENEEIGKDLATLLQKYEKKGLQGAVLIAKDGVIVYKSGFGYADASNKRKNAADTLFDIGSVSKHFTAAAILKLAEQGKLKLEDSLDKFFKDCPKDKAKITLSQLLSQSSGIARDYDAYGSNLVDRDVSMKELLAIPLSSAPGTKFEYSNANYYLAGAIVEIASKETYEQYLEKNIFAPAGMKDTGFCSDKGLDRNRSARRYEDGQDKGLAVDWPFTWGQRGCGYIISTAEDMLKWSTALEDETVLTEESKELYFKEHLEGYALGWFKRNSEGDTDYMYHGGSAPGARAFFARFPADDFMFVLLLNSSKAGEGFEFELWPEIEHVVYERMKG
ncbi:MAG: beta-lactamase family protein [Planctomycetes bacterium]|nr:beta-lactamase family protein [Planctomycetota bacterium]